MAIITLDRFVESKFLQNREFPYRTAYLEKANHVNKIDIYFQDPATGFWRYGEEPHHTRGFFVIMALETIVLFAITEVLRVIQITISFVNFFFKTYKTSYQNREKNNCSEIFFNIIETNFTEQRKELVFIGRSVIRDIKCALSMFVSAVIGMFCRKMNQVLKMEVIFSETERQWNQGVDFDRKDNVEEKNWHIENSMLANCMRHIKNCQSRTRSFSTLMQEFREIGKYSNRSFYLYPYAQPLSQRFVSRLNWTEEVFFDYDELVRYHTRQTQEAMLQSTEM